MTEKLVAKFGSGPHKLNIGKSFETKKGGATGYHTIRYDFTPKSIDEESMGSLEVKERSSVSVSLPHNDGVGKTLYKGNAEPAPTKDCVLIIDHETGEMTLERISSKIMVKKTRQEKSAGGQEPRPDAGNPYEVKPVPRPAGHHTDSGSRPSEVKSGQKPRAVSGPRPSTPHQPQLKKRPPGELLVESLSPMHSNKSSPASTSGRGPGGQTDSLGRPLSSDSSDSSSSDSDPDDPPPPKAQPAPARDSMPSDLEGLLGGGLPVGHNRPTPPPAPAVSMPDLFGSAGGLGSLANLDDDLELSDDDSE